MYKRLLALLGVFHAASKAPDFKPVSCKDIIGSSWEGRDGEKSLTVENIAWIDKETERVTFDSGLLNTAYGYSGLQADVTFPSIAHNKALTFKTYSTCTEYVDGSIYIQLWHTSGLKSRIDMSISAFHEEEAVTVAMDDYEDIVNTKVFSGDLFKKSEPPKIAVQSSEASCPTPMPR